MAFPSSALLGICDIPQAQRTAVTAELAKHGLVDTIDLAMFDEDDLHGLNGNGVEIDYLVIVWHRAGAFKNGWASLEIMQMDRSARSSAPSVAPTINPPRKAVGALSTLASFAKRVALSSRIVKKKILKPNAMTMEGIEAARMEEAKERINKVLLKYAMHTPRMQMLAEDTPLMWSLQNDTYRLRSRSAKVVSRRAAMLEGSFKDVEAYAWNIMEVTPFQVAAWVRGRVLGGPKCSASSAREILVLVSSSTDANVHMDSPLVKGQLSSLNQDGTAQEPGRKQKTSRLTSFRSLRRLQRMRPLRRCVATAASSHSWAVHHFGPLKH